MRKNRGIGLVELMIAAVILVSCVLLFLGMFSVGAIRMRQSRVLATSSFLAKQKMEEVLIEDDITTSEGSFAAPFSDYGYRVNVKPYKADPLFEQIEVTVTSSNSPGGRKVTVAILRSL